MSAPAIETLPPRLPLAVVALAKHVLGTTRVEDEQEQCSSHQQFLSFPFCLFDSWAGVFKSERIRMRMIRLEALAAFRFREFRVERSYSGADPDRTHQFENLVSRF